MLIFYDISVSFANDFVVCLFVCRIKLEIKIFAFKCYMNTVRRGVKFVLLEELFFLLRARLNEKLHLTHSLDLLHTLKFGNFARIRAFYFLKLVRHATAKVSDLLPASFT